MKVLKKVVSWMALSILSLMVLAGCVSGNEPRENEPEKAEEIIKSSITEHENFLFRYNIENRGTENHTYDFTSGQRFDYEIVNAKGEVIHLFSSAAMFMQALGTETIPAGQSLVYDLDLSTLELEAGQYTINAWLTPTSGESNKVTFNFKID